MPVNLYGMVMGYLRDREVVVRYAGGVQEDDFEGLYTGLDSRSNLWNLVLDSLLRELGDLGVYVQAFADDVVLMFSGQSASALEAETNRALAHVRDWGDRNKLRFAPSKTNAMVLTRKLNQGVQRAASIYKGIARAAKATWGLSPEIVRTIYVAAIEPIVTYASCAWAPATKKLGVRKMLDALQRSVALKACRAYKTVSLHSALILARLLPLDIRVREAARLYEVKRGSESGDVCADRELEKPVDFREMPHPAHTPELGFESVEDLDPSTVDRLAIVGPHIYTDGSKTEGKVGAALTSGGTKWNPGTPRSGSNPSARYSRQRSRQDIRDIVAEGRKCAYSGCGHAGTTGNERADELARNAALKTAADYDRYPLSYAKKVIRAASLDEWQQRYTEGGTGEITKCFFPRVEGAYRVLSRFTITPPIAQTLTGHGGFAQYLNRFKLKDSPYCACA
ncbi:Putative 115 kDa protein in type-1 retrotransposable element R1DM [Eumeta japonica]|uniref:115 kDa protein in type-1 retrotransposable element R1DM n=1 Tax=Eumeta variegata TaxID=151549 RepID=A0A4C2AAK9_EUMVA|nr:Putative 115 kDa protein in type-1 retrotransposable element R1DM [Eumeta japonica]